jgi:hypothetical protein
MRHTNNHHIPSGQDTPVGLPFATDIQSAVGRAPSDRLNIADCEGVDAETPDDVIGLHEIHSLLRRSGARRRTCPQVTVRLAIALTR